MTSVSQHVSQPRYRENSTVDIRSKYPEKHPVTLGKNEHYLRGRVHCFFASCYFMRRYHMKSRSQETNSYLYANRASIHSAWPSHRGKKINKKNQLSNSLCRLFYFDRDSGGASYLPLESYTNCFPNTVRFQN